MYSLKDAYDQISSVRASAEDLAGIKGFTYVQSPAAATWTIDHALNSYNLDVNVVDGSGNYIIPANIQMTTANQVVLSFGVAITGTARIQAKL